jgi:hypothetical protein
MKAKVDQVREELVFSVEFCSVRLIYFLKYKTNPTIATITPTMAPTICL